MAAIKANLLSDMTPKKKATLGAIIVFSLLIIWQLIGLLGGGGGNEAAVPAVAKSAAPVKMTPGIPNSMGASATSPPSVVVASSADVKKLLAADERTQKIQKASEDKYMQSLNDLEGLKIQREIAEMNQAIASAKLATATAERNMMDLSLKSMPVPVSAAAYANGLVAPTAQGEVVATPSGVDSTAINTGKSSSVHATNDYTVISIFMQGDRWTAVLGYQGKLFNVSVGERLPTDGSIVTAINENAVTLQQNGRTKEITMLSSI